MMLPVHPPSLPFSLQVARRYIKDPELLSFIDIECYCWSTVLADLTPMINAGRSQNIAPGGSAGRLLELGTILTVCTIFTVHSRSL